jgi:hypothetical protein
LWGDWNYGRTADNDLHWHYIDTMSGQSGAPVYVYDGSSRYIISVHTYGDDGTYSNTATRLNQDKYDQIITWLNSDPIPSILPDLIDDGDSFSGFSPITVIPGVTTFNVYNNVRNIGMANSGSFNVSYYASKDANIYTSDYLIGSVSVQSISPSSTAHPSWSGIFPNSIPYGVYYVGWIIDSNHSVSESNENNNIAYKTGYTLLVAGTPLIYGKWLFLPLILKY